jgi:hypothetical protein
LSCQTSLPLETVICANQEVSPCTVTYGARNECSAGKCYHRGRLLEGADVVSILPDECSTVFPLSTVVGRHASITTAARARPRSCRISPAFRGVSWQISFAFD